MFNENLSFDKGRSHLLMGLPFYFAQKHLFADIIELLHVKHREGERNDTRKRAMQNNPG